MFETEHVIDPLVKFGDRVTAGQRIATVSDYDRSWKAMGYGLVEIGVAYNLGNDGIPWHACLQLCDPGRPRRRAPGADERSPCRTPQFSPRWRRPVGHERPGWGRRRRCRLRVMRGAARTR